MCWGSGGIKCWGFGFFRGRMMGWLYRWGWRSFLFGWKGFIWGWRLSICLDWDCMVLMCFMGWISILLWRGWGGWRGFGWRGRIRYLRYLRDYLLYLCLGVFNGMVYNLFMDRKNEECGKLLLNIIVVLLEGLRLLWFISKR